MYFMIITLFFGTSFGTEILIFGGLGDGVTDVLSSVERLDLDSGSISQFEMPYPLFGHTASLQRGFVFLSGGSNGKIVQKQNLLYNLKKNNFTGGPNMTDPRLFGEGISLDHFTIVCGGYNGNWWWNPSCESLDLNGVWSKLNFRSQLVPKGMLISLKNVIYTLGGRGSINGARVLKYTPEREWEEMPNMIRARSGGAVTTFGSSIVVCGGMDGERGRSCDVFHSFEQKWYNFAPLNIGRQDFHLITVGPRIFAIGGARVHASGPIDSIEEYDLEKEKWVLLSQTLNKARSEFAVVVV